MFIQRLHNLPILCLLVICLLISPAVKSGYAWGAAADDHSLRNEVVAGDSSSDDYVETAAYRWGKSPSRHGHQPGSLLASIAPTAVLQVRLPERSLNPHRFAGSPPRISSQILHHRTIVLLI